MKVQKLALAVAAVLGAALLAGCGVVPTNQSALQPMTNPSTTTTTAGTAPSETPSTAQTTPPAATDPAQQPAGSYQDSHHGGSIGTATVALSEQDAVDIALQHAQVAQSDTVFLQVEGDRDNGRYLYEVEFYVGPVEYKYEIDASTGTILEFEREQD